MLIVIVSSVTYYYVITYHVITERIIECRALARQ